MTSYADLGDYESARAARHLGEGRDDAAVTSAQLAVACYRMAGARAVAASAGGGVWEDHAVEMEKFIERFRESEATT